MSEHKNSKLRSMQAEAVARITRTNDAVVASFQSDLAGNVNAAGGEAVSAKAAIEHLEKAD